MDEIAKPRASTPARPGVVGRALVRRVAHYGDGPRHGGAIWNYSTDEDVTTASRRHQRRAGAGLKYDYFLSERWSELATTRALSDTLADLQLRFTAGLGAGYTMVKTDNVLFLAEAGLSSYSEDYRQAGLATEETVTARLSYRLEYSLSEATRLVHRVEAFPSVEDGDDYYLQAVTE